MKRRNCCSHVCLNNLSLKFQHSRAGDSPAGRGHRRTLVGVRFTLGPDSRGVWSGDAGGERTPDHTRDTWWLYHSESSGSVKTCPGDSFLAKKNSSLSTQQREFVLKLYQYFWSSQDRNLLSSENLLKFFLRKIFVMM